MDPLGRELHPPACFSPPPLPPVPEREHMFEKVVTPSDVGKLNRLVVPKQQAERFFPLEPRLAVKGLFLTFDDLRRRGKRWCFRYSYWHSSQSYVITRGWSRFVREARLAAGDTVSFSRAKAPSAAGGEGRGEEYRLFIDTQHRRKMHHKLQPPPPSPPPPPPPSFPNAALLSAYTCQLPLIGIVQRLDAISAGMPTVAEAAKPRQVRLFGVNLDCPDPGNSFSSL